MHGTVVCITSSYSKSLPFTLVAASAGARVSGVEFEGFRLKIKSIDGPAVDEIVHIAAAHEM